MRRFFPPTALLLASLLAIACASGAATPSPAPNGIWVTDDEGTTVTIGAVPQTIVSLTPATTEILFALGVGDRLRGRTDLDLYPPEATAIPVVATFQGVHIEDVVAIAPDLVIAGGNNFTSRADVARLRELGIPVIVVYAPDVNGVIDDINLIAQAVGRLAAADSVTGPIVHRLDEVEAALAGLDRPRTFYEIGYETEIYGPAPDSFVADMVNLAGGDPITTTDPAVFAIPLERLVTLDPEVIVLGDAAYGICPGSVATRAGWAGMTAVRDGQVRPADDIIITLPGPRLGEGLAALALAIHPDAEIEPPTEGTEYCSAL
jgi:iron complex transport system substrate-binding protein